MEIVSLNQISPDQVIIWSWSFITLNATILYTWLVMAILVVGSWLVTRNLSSEMNVSRWQHFLEVIISIIRGEISEMTKKGADKYIPLVGTLFLFICVSNVLVIVPGFVAPTSSMTTTAALASCVFIAVPFYGISRNGLFHYVSFRQHYESRKGGRYSASRYTFFVPGGHADSGTAHWGDPGLHFCDPFHGLYRFSAFR